MIETAPEPITVDIVSDVVCPWCYVGKRRLEAAMALRPGVAVDVRWHPFQLDPAIPPGGLDRRTYMTGKFGSMAAVDALHARLDEAGREEGLAFAFDRITRSVNTLDSHRLLTWARPAGVQNEAKEALMLAYFMDGRDIGDPDVLADIAASVGMDADAVRARLGSDESVEQVRFEIEQAVQIGVSGVPFFIFGERFALSGAQPAEVLARALDEAGLPADSAAGA